MPTSLNPNIHNEPSGSDQRTPKIFALIRSAISDNVLPATAIAAALGYGLFLAYCLHIDYLPSLSLSEHLALFIALTILGLVVFLAIVVFPYVPGLVLWHAATHDTSAAAARPEELAKFRLFFLVTASCGASIGVLADLERHNRWGELTSFVGRMPQWLMFIGVLALIVSSAYVFSTFVFGRGAMKRGNLDRLTFWIMALVGHFLAVFVMVVFAPVLLRMSEVHDQGSGLGPLFAAFPVLVLVMGNVCIIEARYTQSARKALFWMIGLFAGMCVVFLFVDVSKRVVRAFSIGDIPHISLVLNDDALAQLPPAARLRVKAEPVINGSGPSYTLDDVHLLLRIGNELRLRLDSPGTTASESHPSARLEWTIPNADRVTWYRLPNHADRVAAEKRD